jgi:hypothetical protein
MAFGDARRVRQFTEGLALPIRCPQIGRELRFRVALLR